MNNWMNTTFARREELIQALKNALQKQHPPACKVNEAEIEQLGYCPNCGWISTNQPELEHGYTVRQKLSDIHYSLRTDEGKHYFTYIPKHGTDIMLDVLGNGEFSRQAEMIKRLYEPMVTKILRNIWQKFGK